MFAGVASEALKRAAEIVLAAEREFRASMKFSRGPAVDLSAIAKRRKRKTVTSNRSTRRVREPRPKPGGWKPKCQIIRGRVLAAHIAAAMAPDGWYARPDIELLTRLNRGSIKARTAAMVTEGLLERALNPEWVPIVYPKGEKIDSAASIARHQPYWLFRLTADGCRLRHQALLLA